MKGWGLTDTHNPFESALEQTPYQSILKGSKIILIELPPLTGHPLPFRTQDKYGKYKMQKMYYSQTGITHMCQMDSSTLNLCTSPFPIEGMSG